MHHFFEQLEKRINKIENLPTVYAIRTGLVRIIPVLMIGSISLVLQHFPISQYQNFVENVFNGNLMAFFNYIYNSTFGMLSVFLVLSISYSYTSHSANGAKVSIIPSLSALISFFILSGITLSGAKLDALGVKGMFVAIVSAICSTKLLNFIYSLKNGNTHKFSDGTDVNFNDSVLAIIPMLITVSAFALVNTIIVRIFHVSSFYHLFIDFANAIFLPFGRSFVCGILFVFVSSVLWFFGIHGSDVLESVVEKLFIPALQTNIDLVAAGKAPTEILTKQFFDVFVLMGGCGTAICLLLAILIFSKKNSNRRLSKLAAVPMLFNINEIMIFGLPVIFNPIILVPFVLTPLVAFLTTYVAMRTGIVPLVTSEVNWTAPVFISGYSATGSIAGSILQLFNIIIGVFIYRPFILMYDRSREHAAMRQISELVDILKQSEETVTPVTLTELTDEHGGIARFLVEDIRLAISEKSIKMFYQPQFNMDGECISAEALMRWKHPLYGTMYPPLVVKLAEESDLLPMLEEYVLLTAVNDTAEIRKTTGFTNEIGVNISADTVQSEEYYELLKSLIENGTLKSGDICLEVTEQSTLKYGESTFKRFEDIKGLGYRLAIDDFSMGHTSLTYLQDNHFDFVKLDGSLVTGMTANHRSYDIIKSITQLSRKLGFSVIAEYVETDDQMQMLKDAGCYIYQGYLFSPAIDKDEFIKLIKNGKKEI